MIWLLLSPSLAKAQAMIEVPNDPELLARIAEQKRKDAEQKRKDEAVARAAEEEWQRQLQQLLPPPSLQLPPPPPIIVAAPPLRGHFETRRRWELLGIFGNIFIVSYGINAFVGERVDGRFYVPVAGPIAYAVKLGGGDLAPMMDFGLVLDAIVQGGSLALAILGPFLHKQVWVVDHEQ